MTRRCIIAGAFLICVAGLVSGLQAQAAGISGKWTLVLSTGQYSAEYPADLQVEGERVTGTLAEQKVDGTFKDGQLALKFSFRQPEAPDMENVLEISARLGGDALSGEFAFGEYAGSVEGMRRR